jgi:hypothetical protein
MTSGQGHHRLPVGSARTWLQQQYYSARCQNHRPPKGGVSRESSRISWRMQRSDGPKALPPEGRGTPRSITSRLPDSCGKPRSTPGARATRRLRPWVASATSTTTATVEPTSTRGCTEATTPGVGDATTAGRIGAPRPILLLRRLSAGPYDGRCSRTGSEPRLPSQSTRGRSPTGTTWSKPLPATSRARTCALGTPGISEAAASSRESLSGTTSGDSRSSAPSCPTSPTQTSSARSSPAPSSRTRKRVNILFGYFNGNTLYGCFTYLL